MTEDLSGDSIAKTAQNIADTGGGGGGGGGGGIEVSKSSNTGDADFEHSNKAALTICMTKPTTTTNSTTTTTAASKTTTITSNNNDSNQANNNNYNKNNVRKNDVGNLTVVSPPTPPAPPSIFLCNNPANCVTLKNILESLKTPIVEEQAWALIYQFIALYRNMVVSGVRQVFADNEIPNGIENLSMHHDGSVHCSWADNIRKSLSCRDLQQESQKQQQRHRQFHKDMERLKGPYSHAQVIASHEQVLKKIALLVYTALDYNLPQYEQCTISQELEDLITHMTSDDNQMHTSNEINDDDDENNIDEGIDDETTDEPNEKCYSDTKVFDYVLEVCRNHIKPTVPEGHYRAVCRAFVTEYNELRVFLQTVFNNGTNTLHSKLNSDASKQELAKLGFVDWARFWVQVIDELRRGVRLKKANYERAPIEYELTPYEILMEDIRSKKYQLKKVMVNGDIPPRVKKDAHAVILEFIRSRPPLKKASERKLPPPIKLTPSPRELLLDSIRKGQPLKHIPPPSPRLKDRLLPPTGPTTSATLVTPEALSLPNISVTSSCSSNATTAAATAAALEAQQQSTTAATKSEVDEADIASARTTPRTKQRLIKVPISLLQASTETLRFISTPYNLLHVRYGSQELNCTIS